MSKLLDQIEYPADLRKLNRDQLEKVSEELREELIDVVSETGGHLGAGLRAAAAHELRLRLVYHVCVRCVYWWSRITRR